MNVPSLKQSVAVLAIVGVMQTPADGQRYRSCPPAYGASSIVRTTPQMRLTYGGKVYFDFGNYTVAVHGTPAYPGSYSRHPSARVIVDNGRGTYWDGSSYFIHSSYRYDLVSKHYFTERTIGTLPSSSPIKTPSKRAPPLTMSTRAPTDSKDPSMTVRYLPPPIPPKLVEKQREISNRNSAKKTRERLPTSPTGKK